MRDLVCLTAKHLCGSYANLTVSPTFPRLRALSTVEYNLNSTEFIAACSVHVPP